MTAGTSTKNAGSAVISVDDQRAGGDPERRPVAGAPGDHDGDQADDAERAGEHEDHVGRAGLAVGCREEGAGDVDEAQQAGR